MTTQPDIADCWQAYLRTCSARDALRREGANCAPGHDLYGLTSDELDTIFDAMAIEAEVVAVFGLSAACEATIRVASRMMADSAADDPESVAVRALYRYAAAKNRASGPPVVGNDAKKTIVGVWLKARARPQGAHQELLALALLRHWIAHGRHFSQR